MGLVLALALPGAAWAMSGNGISILLTERVCSDPAGTNCTIRPSIQKYSGGTPFPSNSAYSYDFGGGNTAQASVAWSPAFISDVKAAAFSDGDFRVGFNVVTYQTFTWGGATPIDLAINGSLHYVTTGDANPGDAAGEGSLLATIRVLSNKGIPELDPHASPMAIFNCAFSCGNLYAQAQASSLGTTGDNRLPIAMTIRLDPGAPFVIETIIQGFANRGGSIDALHTFTAAFDPEHSYYADTQDVVGRAALEANLSPAPEPGAWALLIAGFGLAGARLRARRRVSAA